MGALGGDRFVVTIGGGESGFAQAVKAACGSQSLAEDEGVKTVAQSLPKEATGVLYVSASRTISLAIGMVVGQTNQRLPAFPVVRRPIALAVDFEGRSAELQVALPIELIIAFQRWWGRVQEQPIQTP
jgi:hypothetical protein